MPVQRRPVELALVVVIAAGALHPEHSGPQAPTLLDHGKHVDLYYPPDREPIVAELVMRIEASAVSMASITRGGRHLAGNVTVCETDVARLIPGDVIRYAVEGARLGSVPVVSTNTEVGLRASLIEQDDSGFMVRVESTSRGRRLGTISVSNIVYELPIDASAGPVNIEIRGSGWASTITNALIDAGARN